MLPQAIALCEPEVAMHLPKDRLIPLGKLAHGDEIDDILRPVLKAGRKEVHTAIEEVLEGWPGRKRGELWVRLRQLRKERRTDRRHAVWSEEDLRILHTYYAQGRTGARQAVKELLARHPNWNAGIICRKAAELGISTGSGTGRARSMAICFGTPERSRSEELLESWEGAKRRCARCSRVAALRPKSGVQKNTIFTAYPSCWG